MQRATAKPIPLLDLTAQHRQIREEVMAAVVRVIDSQKFVMGEEVEQLEREIADYSGARFGVGCASGTDALFLALLALDLQPGDEVLTVPFTFFATAGVIHRAGLKPVFTDIEPATFNMDPARAAETLKRHPKIKAIIPVHLFGGCADMDPLLHMAKERGIPVIEDAAQSIGAEYHGRRAGSLGEMGCFSFYPTKNLGAYGDAGMVTTNDAALAERLGALRLHGSRKRYFHDWVGINSHMDALQAAVLRVKFRHLDSWSAARQHNALLYREILSKLALPIGLPAPGAHQNRHIYNQFSILCPRRDELQAHLKQRGIGTEIYYPLSLHLQVCFEYLGYKAGDFPVSERVSHEILALPIQPELTAQDIEQVCGCIQEFYA